jgi:hypothetical protein
MSFFPSKPAPPKLPEIDKPEKPVIKDIPKVSESTTGDKPKQEAPKKQDAAAKKQDSQKSGGNREAEGGVRQNTSQTSSKRAGQQSGYERGQNFQQAEIPTEIGHKINMNQQVAKQRGGQQSGDARKSGPELNQANLAKLQKAMQLPKPPSPKSYQMLLKQPAFRSVLKDTPVHQKLQQRAVTQQQVAKQTQANRDMGEVLKKGEFAQLFRMRNNGEKREMRDIVKYELAKLKKQMAKQRVQSVNYKTDSSKQRSTNQATRGHTSKTHLTKQQLAATLNTAESKFEQMLQKFLSGERSVASLAEGVRAKYATKSNWNQFFKSVTNLKSAEIADQGELSKLIDAVFRGLFQKEGDGKLMLVSDLSFTEEGMVAERKYSQIAIKDSKLGDLLKSMLPGDVINPETLKMLGSEFDFLKLANLAQIAALTEAEKLLFMKQLKQRHSPASHKKLEEALKENRSNQQKGKKPFEYAGHMHDAKERYPGKPKFFMYLLYAVTGITAALCLYLVIKNFM